MLTVRRLTALDLSTLRQLALDDAAFDLESRGESLPPLDDLQARAFLEDPAVLFWVAEDAAEVIGFMYCHVLRKRSQPARATRWTGS